MYWVTKYGGIFLLGVGIVSILIAGSFLEKFLLIYLLIGVLVTTKLFTYTGTDKTRMGLRLVLYILIWPYFLVYRNSSSRRRR